MKYLLILLLATSAMAYGNGPYPSGGGGGGGSDTNGYVVATTNFVINQIYTNVNSQAYVSMSIQLTNPCSLALYIDDDTNNIWDTTNNIISYDFSSTGTFTNILASVVMPNARFMFTNVGTGPIGAPVTGACRWVSLGGGVGPTGATGATGAAGGSTPTTSPTNKIAYVNTTIGNDSTAVLGNQWLPYLTISNAVRAATPFGSVQLTAGQTNYISSAIMLSNVTLAAYGSYVVVNSDFTAANNAIFDVRQNDNIFGGKYIQPNAGLTTSFLFNDGSPATNRVLHVDNVSVVITNGATFTFGGGSFTNDCTIQNSTFWSRKGFLTGGDPHFILHCLNCTATVDATGLDAVIGINAFMGNWTIQGLLLDVKNASKQSIGLETQSGDNSFPCSYTINNSTMNVSGAGGALVNDIVSISTNLSLIYNNFIINGVARSSIQSSFTNISITADNPLVVNVAGPDDTNWCGTFSQISTNAANGMAVYQKIGGTNLVVYLDSGVNISPISWVLEAVTNDANAVGFSATEGVAQLPPSLIVNGITVSNLSAIFLTYGKTNVTTLNGDGFVGPSLSTSRTNTLVVTSSGVTNITAFNYLLSITAGTGLSLKSGDGTTILTPAINGAYPLKPGWRFTGTAVTAQAVIQ